MPLFLLCSIILLYFTHLLYFTSIFPLPRSCADSNQCFKMTKFLPCKIHLVFSSVLQKLLFASTFWHLPLATSCWTVGSFLVLFYQIGRHVVGLHHRFSFKHCSTKLLSLFWRSCIFLLLTRLTCNSTLFHLRPAVFVEGIFLLFLQFFNFMIFFCDSTSSLSNSTQ